MENEKMVINTGNGTTEVIIREGAAAKVLDPKAPMPFKVSGTLGAVSEYLTKRVKTEQFAQKNCHIIVNRDNVSLTLVFNERDEYTHGEVSGRLQVHPDFASLHINERYAWTPTELAMLLKMHRYWFKDRMTCMQIVTTLMNFTADVNQKIEQSIKENGSNKNNFEQVVNSNLPESINLTLPMFKGYAPEVIEVEFFASVEGRDVSFALLSAGAIESLESIRNNAIDEQLEKIREIAPEIAIIEE